MEIEVYLEKNFQVWVRTTHDPAQTKSLLIYLLTSIIVSRTWKLRFTSKRISRYGSGLLMTQLKQSLYLFTYLRVL